jgi:hypothetical protein
LAGSFLLAKFRQNIYSKFWRFLIAKSEKKMKLKSPDFSIWFSLCSPKYRRTIKDLYLNMVYSQIWLNFLGLIAMFATSSYGLSPVWLQTKIPHDNTAGWFNVNPRLNPNQAIKQH